ncbi:NAD(P)H oxidoreductase [Cokeromyces recurvatus]|uniref:NAD(P)H oxidoreductase n=1 Tax=Cokeromyces recurvatus TaxID=90255 RepID=UPI00221F7C5A|nr:NAD(P)H oxidoreductase [Cokeromyces recurvatus]KAI7908011.1 NAD(P)H oxidoreductase [Cokeromyces recurvatus]
MTKQSAQKILIVLSHHRENSLTYQIKSQIEKGLKASGHEVVDTLDLFKENFNPILREPDEPQWSEPEQHFSEEVNKEMERLLKYDSIIFVFPMYWFGMPAMLKGYVERVWNYGFAYGAPDTKLKSKKVLWCPLAGASAEVFRKYKYDDMVNHYFNVAIAGFCGIQNSKVNCFFRSNHNTPEGFQKLIEEGYRVGLEFDKW